MTATVYDEPHKLRAAVLAVVVHGAFFALLYFGFTWQTQPSATMSVELWQSLPDVVAASPARHIVEEVVPPPQPEETVKPDIVLPDKKKVEAKPVVPKRIEDKRVEKKPAEIGKIGNISAIGVADQQAAQATREQAEKAAVIGRVVDEYRARIIAKIRSNVVEPPGVANDARAIFLVTLLPGGTVLDARLTKPSGNAAYDNAVERAILKSQPLPLPADVTLFNHFRELELAFRPEPEK
jgi:colicin import membrane protein